MGQPTLRSALRATVGLPRVLLAAVLTMAMALAAAGGLFVARPASAASMNEGLFVSSQNAGDVQSQAQQLGVPVNTMTVFADGSGYNSYSPPSGSLTLLLGVGALTPSQATSIGQSLVASGHADTVWRVMWEMNQNVSGWFDPWNQNSMSASTYISTFQSIVTAARAVAGQHFVFMWNPDGSTGNDASGRTWNDTYPGNAYVDEIGVDQYDWSGYQANIQRVLAFAQAQGKPFAMPEWGLNGSDDPAYINYVSSVVHGGNVALEAYFDYAGSINSWLGDFPQSSAAFTADFGSVITTTTAPPATTTPPTTTPPTTTPPTTTPPTTTPPTTTPPTTTPAPHVMVVMMENQGYSQLVGSSAVPYISGLASGYGSATKSYGLAHPSLPDYIALASGSNQGVTIDETPAQSGVFNVPTIATQLAAAGVSVRTYAENLPSNPANDSGLYVAHHNPWVYFKSPPPVENSTSLVSDLNSANAPSFVWFTPNANDDGDGESTEASQLAGEESFLSAFIPEVQATSWYKANGQIIIEWDESLDSDTSGINGGAGGHIPTIVVSAALQASPTQSTGTVDSVGILHSLEDAYGLNHLGGSSADGTIDSLLGPITPPVTPPTTTPPTTTPPTTTPPTTTPPTTTPPTTTPPPTTTTTTPPAPTSAPGAPTGIRASVSGTTVTVSWTNAAGTLGDNVYRDGSEIAWPGWPSVVVNTYQDAGVAAGTHTYTVAGYNSSGVGSVSAAVTVTVPVTPPTTTPPTTTPPTTTPPTTTPPPVRASAPGVPTGIKASVSGTTVTVSWTNAAGTLGDDVYRDGSEIAWPGWPSMAVSSYQDTNVAVGSHTYTVGGYNSSGVGPISAAVTVTVASPGSSGSSGKGSPAAPSGLTATVKGTTVTVSWVNSAGTLGDNVYRDGTKVAWPGWPSAPVTTYVDTGVAPGSHTYSVTGYNSSGEGPHTVAVTVNL